MRLTYKFFGSFLICIVFSLILMVVILRIYASISFSNYINTQMFEQLQGLSSKLANEYQRGNNWDSLKSSPSQFLYLVEATRVKSQFQNKPEKRHPKPPQGIPFITGEHVPPPPPPPGMDKHGIKPPHLRAAHIQNRISLFDASNQYVAGASPQIKKHDLRDIRLNNETIGYIGLLKHKPPAKPHDIGFLRQQFNAFYIVGFCILIISAMVAFILSRHLLNPIRQLTRGTHELASLKFHTRLPVGSRDELGQLASDFNAMASALEQSERMKKQWITDISHELRTPLSILQGEIEALQDGVRSLNSKALESLHHEVSHINTIVRDLYDLSLADSGTLTFVMASVDPVAELLKTISLFQIRFDREQIQVEKNLSETQGYFMTGDEARLSQMYSNIFENVLRYTQKPGVLSLDARIMDGNLLLSFEDSGPGVPDGSLSRLFDRLYRVDPSRSRESGGCGLGLSICKSITEALGGSIRAAHSSLGGLGIFISLPLNQKTPGDVS